MARLLVVPGITIEYVYDNDRTNWIALFNISYRIQAQQQTFHQA